MKTRVVAFVSRTATPARQAARIFREQCADGYDAVEVAVFGKDGADAARILAVSDILIFINKRSFDDAASRFALDPRKCLIWYNAGVSTSEVAVKNRCTQLIQDMTTASWVDIIDDSDHETGISLPLVWAIRRGLRKRIVHVVLIDSSGNVIVEKRSQDIVFSPGLLDITLGGSVDADEAPMTAARREAFEELGIRLAPGQLRPLSIEKVDSWHPHYQVMDRTYRYAYCAHLTPDQEKYTLQQNEVSGIAFLTPHAVNKLMRTHYLQGMGPLNTTYKFYRTVVRRALRYDRAVKSSKKGLSRVK